MILEIHLHDLVRQPEHDGVLGPHPLLDVDLVSSRSFRNSINVLFLSLGRVRFQVRSEMLEESDLLVQLFRVLLKSVDAKNVLLLILIHRLPLVVVEGVTIRIDHDLSRVVEENSSSIG